LGKTFYQRGKIFGLFGTNWPEGLGRKWLHKKGWEHIWASSGKIVAPDLGAKAILISSSRVLFRKAKNFPILFRGKFPRVNINTGGWFSKGRLPKGETRGFPKGTGNKHKRPKRVVLQKRGLFRAGAAGGKNFENRGRGIFWGPFLGSTFFKGSVSLFFLGGARLFRAKKRAQRCFSSGFEK